MDPLSSAALESIVDEALETFERSKEAQEEEEALPLVGLNPKFHEIAKTFQALSGNVAGMQTMDEFLKGQHFHEDSDSLEFAVTKDKIATSDFDSKRVQDCGEKMMATMMADYEKFGQKEDFNQVLENMMRQLLARDLMYEPCKLVCDEYPNWLATYKHDLLEEDYMRYGRQYQYFQRICFVYEKEPDNFPRLMELFQDLQNYGQPPAEIIQTLAPGLHFTPDGMPTTNIDPNVFPTTSPDMPTIPMPDKDAAQQCPVM